VEKKAELQAFSPFSCTEKRRKRSEPSLHVNKDSAITPRQRKRKCDPDPAAADFSFDLQEDISSETNMSLEEEEKPIKECDGLEDYWKDFALAVESSKVWSVNCKNFYSFFGSFLNVRSFQLILVVCMNTFCIVHFP
jgi:DNA repair and recombination protein RAD54 and RAD54-like protein